MKRPQVMVMAILTSGAVALGVPTTAQAAAKPVPVVAVTSATLVTGGTAVAVTASFTCRAGADGLLTVSLTQTRGSTTVTADGQNEGGFTCTGAPQSVEAIVAVQPGGGLFKPGPAQAEGNVLQCDEVDCNSINSTERIRLSK